jgi:hypothetical protein
MNKKMRDVIIEALTVLGTRLVQCLVIALLLSIALRLICIPHIFVVLYALSWVYVFVTIFGCLYAFYLLMVIIRLFINVWRKDFR